ncbi:Protein kinase-like domain protein [Niveomyces insectorum RCEF 264]|uniref:Protein kinase-like domain protein n=1 Tax=Niveomyces insectorum RCEF 264 TaxID=1081102 RepID=A0A167XB80_9HYPO|nr:Protein kinase-like domain protein [Niveomyces insectorum RCEF 264]
MGLGLTDAECRFPRPVQFRLRLSSIHAVAEPLDRMYPWVFQATLVENSWHRYVRAWLPSFPSLIQRFIRKFWPRYALPPTVVIKKLRGLFADDDEIVDKTEDFEKEKAIYQRLKPAQGRLVPEFFGEARCDGRRALVISLLPGATPRRQSKPRLTVEEFADRIAISVRELQKLGLIHADGRLSNIILVDDRIMFIDLEWVQEVEPEWLDHYCTAVSIPRFVDEYKKFLPKADREWEY